MRGVEGLERRRAVAAAFGVDGNQHHALRTFLFNGTNIRGFSFHAVDDFDEQENAEGDDGEIDDVINEEPITDDHGFDQVRRRRHS